MSEFPLYQTLTDDALWAGLEHRVFSKFGVPVGISKMLGASDDKDGMKRWAAIVRPVIESLGSLFPVSCVGPVRFLIDSEVYLQFDISAVEIQIDDQTIARTMMALDPVALCVAMIGAKRWGPKWDALLAAECRPRRIAKRDEPSLTGSELPWVAQNPGGPAPWVAGSTESIARIAGLSEDIGAQRVIDLFRLAENEN